MSRRDDTPEIDALMDQAEALRNQMNELDKRRSAILHMCAALRCPHKVGDVVMSRNRIIRITKVLPYVTDTWWQVVGPRIKKDGTEGNEASFKSYDEIHFVKKAGEA